MQVGEVGKGKVVLGDLRGWDDRRAAQLLDLLEVRRGIVDLDKERDVPCVAILALADGATNSSIGACDQPVAGGWMFIISGTKTLLETGEPLTERSVDAYEWSPPNRRRMKRVPGRPT